ncbi:hypothetical protein JJQ59_04580 [Cupriavidus necator]|nr:EH signature domain-containing protein [Cupriavidus necator]QQX85230.1 hypothetical protein JJQ59_04580 [Cupriavidus necator]
MAMTLNSGIDAVIEEMKARSKSPPSGKPSEDHQLEAVRRFWQSHEVKSFRDAYLLSWSLCIPHRPQGACVLEDQSRLQGVLDGVDVWTTRPSAYRRCYQGLVKSYFTYDAHGDGTSSASRKNWNLLRQYLQDRNRLIKDKGLNPEWVTTAVDNKEIFGEQPCEPFVEALLRGDAGIVDHLCEQLGIGKASWFLRELVLAQVKGAAKLSDAKFQALLPRLLALLAANEVLRDRGMILTLDRYAKVPGTTLHQGLRDHAVSWWGNPWLPSNATRWGGVAPEARAMVADWLKLEFIETFFTKLAEDGLGDPRRMNFWKRYVKAIDHIEFALGSFAENSREEDFVTLRKKMAGLIRYLDASGTNNAFIMTMGNLVAVEFSGLGNALYGYDARRSVPFKTTQILRLAVNGKNSLKQKDKCILWLSHQDGLRNWEKWEHMFEATLKKEFGIEPGTPTPGATAVKRPPPQTSSVVNNGMPGSISAMTFQPYSRARLDKLARTCGLEVDDRTSQGGNLWVRAGESDDAVGNVLTRWGFRNKPGKGWWK